jgi:predicted aldo/keto reductase-like oxidoreductase
MIKKIKKACPQHLPITDYLETAVKMLEGKSANE